MTMSKHTLLASCVASLTLLCTNANANDDENRLFNPGFETQHPAFPDLPLGWQDFNLDSDDYVDIGDMGAQVRSGNRSIRMTASTGSPDRFKGLTTNVFLPDGSDLYDPDYTYLGGDYVVSGYYLVPAGEMLDDTVVGVKLEFRREPPNFSVYTSFEFNLLDIPGAEETGGEWVPFSFTVTDAMMEAVGDFPPYATSASILPFRFYGGDYSPGTEPMGTVFFDDLCVVQLDPNGPCNEADFAEPYNELDFFDLSAFLMALGNQDPNADLTQDGDWDFFDVSLYLQIYGEGCP